MKKWLIPVASMIAVFAAAGTVAGFALAGGSSDAADLPKSKGPATSASCLEGVPDCVDTVEPGQDGAEPTPAPGQSGPGIAVGEPHPGIPPDPPKDFNPCEPDQSLTVSSSGEYACNDEDSAPSGGLGSGSGKVDDDDSVGDEVLAPIDQVDVLIRESFPVQYAVHVVSGLPNSCIEFSRISWERDGEVIRISVINHDTAEGDLVACAMVYGSVENIVELGTDFEPGTTYYLLVNGVKESFLAQ